jgi:hypothetical protein
MTYTMPLGARWVVVNTKAPLLAALFPAPIVPLHDNDDDVADECIGKCQSSLLAQVRRRRPVALLFSRTGRLLRARIPAVGRVTRYGPDRRGCFAFALTGSQLVFRIDPGGANLESIIMDAARSRVALLVVDEPANERVTHLQSWPMASVECEEFPLDIARVSVMTKTKANDEYRKIFEMDSRPPYLEGIPFRFCRGYCHATAQAVVDLLARASVRAGKIWAFAKRKRHFVIRTSSRKSCRQAWWFHAAVVVRSKGSTGGGLWVLDPTTYLERGVVSIDEWTAGFGGALSRVQLTAPEAYRLDCDEEGCVGRPACFEGHLTGESDEELMIARCALDCLSDIEGPPPHLCARPQVRL